MAQAKLILDYVYDHETRLADQVYLTQPTGGGQVKDYTWRQVMDESRRMAAHLKAQNLAPGARIAILSKNCAHFIMAELAIWLAGGTTVAIFPTETADTVRYVLDHSEASLLFVGKLDTFDQQLPGIPDALPRIAFPLAPKNSYESWDAVVARTQPLQGKVARDAKDIGILMYTSGSTGQPKGVMHSFERITAAAEGISHDTKSRIGADVKNRMLSYLPLAHVFERAWVESASLVDGNTHLFFAESLDTFVQDLNRAKPITFISVPRLWLKFQQGVFAKMPPKKLDRLLSIPILGKIVGRKVLKGLGLDHALLAGSGSAPIPSELIAWYRRLGLNLIEGYAMTEDFAYSHNSTAKVNAPGCVGVPLKGVEVRISEEGEVLIKSPGQFVGYYKRPDLDAEVFTEDGFFRTGDKGERRADGLLRLTGRVKELFKTSKGKYVAPAPIENRINACPLIELSMVSGVGHPSAYAMVVLAETVRPTVKDPAVKAQITADLTQLLKDVNSELADYEKLQMLVIAPEPWSIENGFLTPTMKIRRNRIEAAVEPQLDRWYSGKGTVQWA
ncbi:MAG: AMP-binding acetyl-CoA synthetase [Curvibacter sp. RIFCSPHIGHO2_12_FULL_63_18]|uniref:AMP-binding protein n=1 Tax=Rhodoferax sp. TaxID=50421 RepID=UPI0008BCC884|nr:AMP-binding protein [Rhodoferax sp.]OGO99510.1 MAG: AMP-binding acetyl-CoA synthetase [Curvibacter sp. GWA2_63_95]OGP04560.1 MAG: AMP-binding acetyl-CoA synthetase [Curvibacter sp. RIFCSPHIGHO2_12_FULL_63_18]HCX80959.1 AMP-binding acetyl-CoA synthetase [Rhodoferax sp.]